MQPKPSSMLRLQDFTIKTWFSSTKLDIGKNSQAQNNVLDLMLATNDKTILDWNKQLEFVHTKKKVIQTDVLRYCDLIRTYTAWIHSL